MAGLTVAAAGGNAIVTQLTNSDTITFPTSPASGFITYAYNGAPATAAFNYSAATTPAQLQAYLATIPGLTGSNAVTVAQQLQVDRS